MFRKYAAALLLVPCVALAILMGCGKRDAGTAPESSAPARGAATKAPAQEGPPNIVLILIDTLRADKLSCYGYPQETTPELDALAAKGVLFRRAISQCSWTRPSMAAMLTSIYARTLGMYKEKNEMLNDKFVTLAEILNQHGYTTFGITANPVMNSAYNMHQGFDKYVDSHIVFSWMGANEGEVTAKNRKLIPDTDVFRKANELVDAAGEGPFYLQLIIMEMHEYWRKSTHLLRKESFKYAPEHETAFQARRYIQALRQVSIDVSRFIAGLEARPGWENTLFVIVSDHGEGLDSHPDVKRSTHHGRLLYESNVHVPFMLYHPNWSVDRHVVDEPVRILDLMPTVLDFAKVPLPGHVDGVSLLPAIAGKPLEKPLPPFIITETQFRNYNKTAVYGPEWMYIENRDRHGGVNARELQAAGGGENGRKTDQIAVQTDVAEKMQAYLRDWEKAHAKTPATAQVRQISKEEQEQMEGIGYLK